MKSLHGPTIGQRSAVRPGQLGRSTGLLVRNIAEAQRTSSSKASPSALPQVLSKVKSVLGKGSDADLSAKDAYSGVAYAVRDELIEKFNKTHAHWAVSLPPLSESNCRMRLAMICIDWAIEKNACFDRY